MAMPPPQEQFQVLLSSGEGGNVVPAVGSYTVPYGAVFTVEAQPNIDMLFDRHIINGREEFERVFSLPVYATLVWTVLFKPRVPEPEPPVPLPPSIPKPIPVPEAKPKTYSYTLPLAFAWLQPFVDMLADGLTNAVLFFQNIQASANNIVLALQNVLSGAWTSLSESFGDLFTKGTDAYAEAATATMGEALKGSPAWAAGLSNYAAGVGTSIKDYSAEAVSNAVATPPSEDLDQYKNMADQFVTGAILATLPAKVFGLVAEVGGLGQIQGINGLVDWYDNFYGITEMGSAISKMPLEKSMMRGFELWLNTKIPMNVPDTGNLINMVVKEKMSLEDFKKYMLWQGFKPDWSQLIWDAHFEPAAMTDFLTAWRRGRTVTVPAVEGAFTYTFGQAGREAQDIDVIQRLSKLADYDPAYWSFFETRLYNDVPLSFARWMFQTGAITPEQVHDIVRRSGIDRDYADATANMIMGFDKRTYQRRYWMALQTGLSRGVVSEEELKAAMGIDPTTKDVADWMVLTADVRKRIAEAPADIVKEKILSLADLRKLYLSDKINEVQFTNRLTAQGYGLDDIQLLLGLLNDQKVAEGVPKPVLELSIPELLAAWRYGEMIEDTLRARLLLKGLPLGDVDLLIRTKKKQWEISPLGA